MLNVLKQIGGNTVAVVDAVLKALPQIQKEVPKGVTLQVVSDQSTFIRKSIKNLQHEAIMGALLAVAIILIFLGSGTSTLIIAHSIPISIISTFVLLYFGKFTLNIMTLGGLALGVGRLVDDAIVVLENINRHIEQGESPEEASYKGAKEVSTARHCGHHHQHRGLYPPGLCQRGRGVALRPDGLHRWLLADGLSFRFAHPGACSNVQIPQTERRARRRNSPLRGRSTRERSRSLPRSTRITRISSSCLSPIEKQLSHRWSSFFWSRCPFSSRSDERHPLHRHRIFPCDG